MPKVKKYVGIHDRFPPEQKLVNRMGFNNEGVEAMADRLWRA